MTAPQDPFSTPPPGGTPPPPPPAPGYGTPGAQPAGYGTPPPYGQQQQYGQPAFGAPGHVPPRNGMGIAALVLGILALVTSFTVVGGVVLGLIAIVLGFLGRGKAKRGQATNGGMALTGAILGIVALLISIAVAALFGSLLSRGDFGSLTECLEQAGNDQAAIDQCSRDFEDSITG